MMSKQKLTPSINVGPLFESKCEAWISVDRSIGEACESRGGFVITGLPPLLIQEDTSLEKFFKIFDLPEPVLYDIAKREMRPDSKLTVRGYVNRDKGGFAYGEQFDLGPEQPIRGPEIDGIDMLINTNAWPSQEPSPGWREELIEHFQRMESLGIIIMRSIARYLGADESAAAKRYENSSSTLRFLRYPKRPDHIEIRGEKGAMRVIEGREVPLVASEHTDNGGLTFQWQDEPGLQIQTTDGEWHGIPNIRDGFSVHLGESLQTQSSGRMRATPHRVYNTGKTRQSMVFFLEPNLFGSVKPFSTGPNDSYKTDEDTYAASMIDTLRRTGRA
jgi:isopenicillin N synthase-like dioxygenase